MSVALSAVIIAGRWASYFWGDPMGDGDGRAGLEVGLALVPRRC
jgi:hypothetical protein